MSEPRARLLVVDDNDDNRDLLARRLERKGFEVDVAEDGAAALAAAEQVAYDLVLLDIMMPGMSGLEVLRRLREARSKAELPILMATAKTESEDVVDALAQGANDYVTKPLDFPVVLARIESHLLVRRQMSEVQPSAPILARDGTLAPGTVLDGRYEILSVVGEGGFAVVFKARQISTDQVVALKLLRAHRMIAFDEASVERRRFEREMKLIGRLRHPHVVRLVDSGRIEVTHRDDSSPDGVFAPADSAAFPPTRAGDADVAPSRERTIAVPYLVMEFLDGRPLSAILRAAGPLSTAEAVDLLVPVLSAVGEAHRAGVVHRDLKPPNIMVLKGPNGGMHPKVLDFGIAKLSDEGAGELTREAGFVGTPEYMSPEQARGSREVTPKSDQYALGVILYECLTGRRPFEGESFIELVHLISAGSFPLPSDRVDTIPEALEAVILRAMHPEPGLRFRSLESFGAALLPFASAEVAAQWSAAFEGPSSSPPVASPSPEAAEVERAPAVSGGARRSDALARRDQVDSRALARRAVAALVIAAFGGLGVAILASGHRPPRAPAEPRGAVHVGVAEAPSFVVDVRVTPEGAEIVLDGIVATVGHLRRSLPRDGAIHALRVSAPGYVPETFRFADVPPPREITLERLDGATPATGAF
jgi:serine/threonine-protein kinase